MKNRKSDILNSKVSYQLNTWADLSIELTIDEVLKQIQSNKYEDKIQKLRLLLENGNEEEYNSHKRTLPAVTFCGTFEKTRKKENIKIYNSIIVIDIDKLEKNEIERVKSNLENDSKVFSFWKSPSNKGFKGLVNLKFNFEIENENLDNIHKSAFGKLSLYFKDKYDISLDQSGSDTSRLCFFSFDPNLIIKEDFDFFEVLKDDLSILENKVKNVTQKIKFASSKDSLFNPKDKNYPSDRKTISSIIRFLERKKVSITSSYADWYKVAMAISNSFTYEIGEKYFLKLSSFDEGKFNEINCKNFLLNCYERRNGLIKFNSIIFLAKKNNYQTKIQKERGSEVEDANLSQVSSSKTVVHLPEDLKR